MKGYNVDKKSGGYNIDRATTIWFDGFILSPRLSVWMKGYNVDKKSGGYSIDRAILIWFDGFILVLSLSRAKVKC